MPADSRKPPSVRSCFFRSWNGALETVMMNNSSNLSILLVIDSLGSGGAQRQLVWLALGLEKRGYDVAVFVFYPENDHFKSELKENKIEILEPISRTAIVFCEKYKVFRDIGSSICD